jgi:DNA-directed RNA polymerase sigma subunit (sigma70/sigma32)
MSGHHAGRGHHAWRDGIYEVIDAAIQSNLRETTTRVLASLTPHEERVLRMRFGIGINADHTLEEVGQQFLGDLRAHP